MCWKIQLGVLALLWVMLGLVYVIVGSAQKEISRFDPFEILEVSTSASAAEIKKASARCVGPSPSTSLGRRCGCVW